MFLTRVKTVDVKLLKYRPVCTQDSIHNFITNFIIYGLLIGTADEELVLEGRGQSRWWLSMRCCLGKKGDRYLAKKGLSYGCIQIHSFLCKNS